MKKIFARFSSFLPKGKVRIKIGDMLVLDRENNIYLHRPNEGKIPITENGNKNILSQIFTSSTYGDLEAMQVITAFAQLTAIAKGCSYEHASVQDIKCKHAIRFC